MFSVGGIWYCEIFTQPLHPLPYLCMHRSMLDMSPFPSIMLFKSPSAPASLVSLVECTIIPFCLCLTHKSPEAVFYINITFKKWYSIFICIIYHLDQFREHQTKLWYWLIRCCFSRIIVEQGNVKSWYHDPKRKIRYCTKFPWFMRYHQNWRHLQILRQGCLDVIPHNYFI